MKNSESSKFDPQLLTTPLLIGCTWYTHLYDEAPWGVAQSDLFQTPQAMLFPNRIQCDIGAASAERAAFNAFNWTSSELFLRAVESNLITLEDFRKPILTLRDVHRKEVNVLLRNIRDSKTPVSVSRILDAKFTDWLLGSPSLDLKTPLPKQAFYYEPSGDAVLIPGWAMKPGVVVAEVFLSPNFYLLPSLNPNKPTPNVKVPTEVIDAVKMVREVQQRPLNLLSSLKITQSQYISGVKPLESKYDEIIDKFNRSHIDKNGRNYLQRFDFLIDMRRKLHKKAVLEVLVNRISEYSNRKLSKDEMIESLEFEVSKEVDGLIHFRRQSIADIPLHLAIAISSTAALSASLKLLSGELVQVLSGGIAGNAWFKIVDSMVNMWHLPEKYPLAYLKGKPK